MRIPFPVHIPLRYVVGFATLLCIIQLLQGTSPYFSVCCFLFIIISGIAFNLAGGFSRTSGGYVFFYTVLTVIVGVCWKAVLGEPADSNLLVPLLTIQVFLGSSVALLAAVYLSRKLTTKRALLGSLVTDENMQNATIGCMVTGFVLGFLLLVVPKGNGSVLSALAQVNRFLPMAIILGVIHQIRKSGGTSSINLPVVLSATCQFCLGLVGFSKEGMFTPFVCWIIAAASQQYKVTLYQIVGGVLAVIFMFQFLVPYSQYGRNFRSETGSFSEDVDTAISLLSDLETARREERATAETSYEADVRGYYNAPQGFLDRLEMISVDDKLINLTDQGHVFGLYPILFSFENLVPHILWPNKPSIGFGNLYAHEIGGMAEDDYTTGISFSPAGESFHMARWIGIFLIAPIMWIMLFTLYDSLCGDVRRAPWGLLVLAIFSHAAPEGMLTGIVYMLGFTCASIIFAALSAAYVMPIFGTLIAGPGRRRIGRSVPVRSIPRRAGGLGDSPAATRADR